MREVSLEGNLRSPEEQPGPSKRPHFITPRLLKALHGIKEETPEGPLVDEGAYLWGVEDQEKGEGIFGHVLLVSRVAYALAEELQEKAPDKFGDVDPQSVVEAALLHDITKLYGEDREKLSAAAKQSLGLRPDFREMDKETDEVGIKWLRELGFPPEVYEAVHDNFPQETIDNPYWKIVLIADYMAGQKVMALDERIKDVRTRWVEKPIAEGKEPRVEEEKFDQAAEIIREVARELFGLIGMTDKEFIERHSLNDPKAGGRWEEFLVRTRGTARPERLIQLVEEWRERFAKWAAGKRPDSATQ
jgi:putative nucleotidyltransferase with HDIG domain